MFKHLVLSLGFSIVFFCSQNILAQEDLQNSEIKSDEVIEVKKQVKIKKKRAVIDASKAIEVKFGNPAWNKNPAQIDSGVVVLRDSKSKKTMQVLMEETAPDSSVYSGAYSVNWGGDASVQPEVYVLKQDQLVSQSELQKVNAEIDAGILKRKPLFYRKGEAGVQILEVFNSKEQAVAAIKILRSQREQTGSMDTSIITKKDLAAAKAVLDASELTKFAAENVQRKKEMQARLVDRFRMEQTDRQKIELLKREESKLSAVEKEKRRRQAGDFAETALELYKTGNYVGAEENFRKSFELDPTNTKYYFQYGLSLYKNQKLNEAIVAFQIAQSDKSFESEAEYYIGLSHYGLKEYEMALTKFSSLKKKKDEKLSPLASFYAALCYFDQKAYPKAKVEFQNVLDTSNDPKMDSKAEAYIESIDRLMVYAKNKAKKFFLNGSLGAMYDSNVLSQSDSASDGSPSDQKSLRYIFGAGIYYRSIFTKKYEFGPKIRSDYIYTQKDAASQYDPWSTQFTAPFSKKKTLWNKSYKMDLKPGYEVLYLGQDDASGKPLKSLKAYFLDWGNTFVMKENWFTTYTLGFRQESFFQEADKAKNDRKYIFKWSNLYFFNSDKTKGIASDLGYAKSNAAESANTYKRIDFSALYLTPMFRDDITFAGGLAFYKLDYDGQDRSDFNKTLNLTLTKPYNDEIRGTLLGSYVLNGSNVESSDYKKWTIGFLITADYGF